MKTTLCRCSILSFVLSVSCLQSLPCHAAEDKPSVSPRSAIPVIFNTDIGGDIDDIWALVMLLKSPQFDVKLITTTFGNADYRAKLIAKMLKVAGRTDIPIGLGNASIIGNGGGGQWPWVQDFQLANYPGKIYRDGVGAIIDTVERSPQPVTVISIGPGKTMAEVLDRSPQTAPKAILVGMYGSIRKGYEGGKVCAECNVVSDTAAACQILSAPWREVIITPLDTCGLVNLSGEHFETLKRSHDPCVQALLENYRIWNREVNGVTGTVSQLQASTILFDTVAVYLANPGNKSLLQMENLSIQVTNDGFTRIDAKGRKMSVATAWKNLDGFRDLLVRTLTRP